MIRIFCTYAAHNLQEVFFYYQKEKNITLVKNTYLMLFKYKINTNFEFV